MAECSRQVDAIAAIPTAQRTLANTLLALEEAVAPVSHASGTYAFLSYVSPDGAVRQRAREMDAELDKFLVALGFREDLYAALKEFAASAAAADLDAEDARYLAFELRDFRRNGLDLPPEPRARLRAIFDRLVELGLAFRSAIDDWEDGIEVTREDLAGLPGAFIDRLRRSGEGPDERFRVSLDYPELHPFLANAESEPLRRLLFEKDQRKGGSENVRRLEEALALRREAAGLLGYDSWAAYVLEERMAKHPAAVEAFLADLRAKLDVKAAADRAEMRALAGREVNIWDWRYYHNRLLRERFEVDEFAVAEYFPLDACLQGLFEATQALLGVRFEPAPEAPRWHPDVQAFDVSEAEGGPPFARFYMDLFPRPNKYGHAAAFTLQKGRRLPDGSYQAPVSAIVANFTKPTENEPSLLRHTEVVTLWHEFGHILHQVLTRAARARFSGTATERDFVEAPSQMLEHWCWEPAVLQRYARHYRTGEPIPEELVARMVAAKNLDSGIIYLRQLYFATLDLAYHTPGFHGDSTATARALHEITGFPFPEGTHFQSGFGHLFGYDAGYYGYLWSEVFGDDMYTRFEADPLDASVGREYRRTVLERGGSVDGNVMVREFLGREPRSEAFLRGIGLAP
jgi:thimet oligopeptidase